MYINPMLVVNKFRLNLPPLQIYINAKRNNQIGHIVVITCLPCMIIGSTFYELLMLSHVKSLVRRAWSKETVQEKYEFCINLSPVDHLTGKMRSLEVASLSCLSSLVSS